jgi:putative transposase
MQGELEQHFAESDSPNRKNGSTKKTMKSLTGQLELDIPCDRTGTFESQIVKKPQTHLTDELERKIIALFSLGNSYQVFAPTSKIYMVSASPTVHSMP